MTCDVKNCEDLVKIRENGGTTSHWYVVFRGEMYLKCGVVLPQPSELSYYITQQPDKSYFGKYYSLIRAASSQFKLKSRILSRHMIASSVIISVTLVEL